MDDGEWWQPRESAPPPPTTPPPADHPPVRPPTKVGSDTFYPTAAAPAAKEPALLRLARDPMRFGATLFAIGFWSVFVVQADIMTQILLGAPIFEELLKLGLALIIVAALRIDSPLARYVLALLPGAGFGLLEHALSYSAEPDIVLYARVAFHAGSTGLGMAAYCLLEGLGDVRVRWGATVLPTIIHAINNFLAVAVAIPAAIAGGEGISPISIGVIYSTSGLTYLCAFALAAWYDPIRERLRRRFPDPAPEPSPDWVSSQWRWEV